MGGHRQRGSTHFGGWHWAVSFMGLRVASAGRSHCRTGHQKHNSNKDFFQWKQDGLFWDTESVVFKEHNRCLKFQGAGVLFSFFFFLNMIVMF